MSNIGLVKTFRKNWFGLLSIGISITMLIIYLTAAGGVRALAHSFAGMKKDWLAGMVLCTLAFWLTDGLILHIYIRMKYKKHSYLKSLKTTMIGLLYNSLTPFGTGAQPMQIYDLTQDGVSAGDAVSFVMVKSLLYQACLTIYAVAVLMFTFSFFIERIPRFDLLLWVGVGLNTFVVVLGCAIAINKTAVWKISHALVTLLAKIRIIKSQDKVLASLNRHIVIFHESVSLMYQRVEMLVFGFLLTVLQQTLFYCLPYCIYRSFNLHGDAFMLFLSAQAILSLIMTYVPIPGGSGFAESGFYLFFTLFFAQGVIMPAVFIWRFLTYYSTIIVGGAISFFDSRRHRKTPDKTAAPDIRRAADAKETI